MAAFLRTHRRRAGMTLESLAAETGLSKSYLSKIERGMSTPSIAVALKIADALRTDVSQLFSDHSDDVALVLDREGDRDQAAPSAADAVYHPIATRMIRKSMQPFVVYPSTDDGQAYLEHPGEEFIYVQSGSIEVTIPTQTMALNQGDSLYFDSNTPHRIRSTSTPRAMVLVVVHDRHDLDGSPPAPGGRRCGSQVPT